VRSTGRSRTKLNDLRDHLFETLEAVKDGSMDIDRAKMITQVAGTIIDTARVEIKFMEVIGGVDDASGFFPGSKRSAKQLAAPN
jgi:hypothetical protein